MRIQKNAIMRYLWWCFPQSEMSHYGISQPPTIVNDLLTIEITELHLKNPDTDEEIKGTFYSQHALLPGANSIKLQYGTLTITLRLLANGGEVSFMDSAISLPGWVLCDIKLNVMYSLVETRR